MPNPNTSIDDLLKGLPAPGEASRLEGFQGDLLAGIRAETRARRATDAARMLAVTIAALGGFALGQAHLRDSVRYVSLQVLDEAVSPPGAGERLG